MKKILLILSILLAIFLLSGCEDAANPAVNVSKSTVSQETSHWDKIVQRNELRVGVPAVVPSFDNELIDAFSKELGIPVTKIEIPWDEHRSDYFQEDCVDLLWGQIPATSDTSTAFRLSTPYFNSAILYLARTPDFALEQTTVMGVLKYSAEEETVQNFYTNVNAYANQDELFSALANGACDVILYNKNLYEATFPNKTLHIVKEVPYELVVAFGQNDVSVCAQVEKTLAKIKADGSASEICLRWYPVDLITK